MGEKIETLGRCAVSALSLTLMLNINGFKINTDWILAGPIAIILLLWCCNASKWGKKKK